MCLLVASSSHMVSPLGLAQVSDHSRDVHLPPSASRLPPPAPGALLGTSRVLSECLREKWVLFVHAELLLPLQPVSSGQHPREAEIPSESHGLSKGLSRGRQPGPG